MKKLNSLISAAFLLMGALIAGLFIFANGDGLKKEAEEKALALIEDLHDRDINGLSVESADRAREYGSYAISVKDETEGNVYHIAVILNEEQTDIDFAIDVTGTYDKYGLAYCH
ncbi:hypothetical protein [Salipaludibacillus aurantiacus]|uniref:Uncharacterized protein n=1 Tax=Salipaludibacillus aurantiacus TaxID=1601833 RepID=A0A1H9WSG3_9BACI|nr:hypothetical protein [Salipaludibacillus aurantiacus]SES36868.1 hypothetical protein SAMN05518684_11987 [Salipaludibacillus aurantiacus]